MLRVTYKAKEILMYSSHKTVQNYRKMEIVDIWTSSVNDGALIMC